MLMHNFTPKPIGKRGLTGRTRRVLRLAARELTRWKQSGSRRQEECSSPALSRSLEPASKSQTRSSLRLACDAPDSAAKHFTLNWGNARQFWDRAPRKELSPKLERVCARRGPSHTLRRAPAARKKEGGHRHPPLNVSLFANRQRKPRIARSRYMLNKPNCAAT